MEENIIELWQEHECLYNVTSKTYHNRSDKEKSWVSIAEALNLSGKLAFDTTPLPLLNKKTLLNQTLLCLIRAKLQS